MGATILDKERVYRQQMATVRDRVQAWATPRGWTLKRRGRFAHASAHGPINGLVGVLDIEMEFESWDTAPDSLSDDSPFIVFASAFIDRSNGRWVSSKCMRRHVTFGFLLIHVDELLAEAWSLLEEIDTSDLRVSDGA